MSLNLIVLEGRIPFDLELKNAEDEKRSFLSIPLSVKRDYKPEGEKYYPEDLLYCKSFGKQAQIINKFFKKGDNIILQGQLRINDDYEKDGEVIKGQPYMHVTGFQFLSVQKENGNGPSSSASGSKAAPSKAPAKKSLSGLSPKKKLNPLSA